MPFTLVGVCHLLPLPAGPVASAGFAAVRERALHDAAVLADAGFDALILENYGDAPFPAGPVEPHVSAFVAILAAEIKARHALRVGINLLRNDAHAALGVAAASGADFIRVNVHTGAMLTDQGILQGAAHATLRYRRELGATVQIAADVLVKHAVPLAPQAIADVAQDTARRGGAEILIVTGQGTGQKADPEKARAVVAAVPEAQVWVGSGVTEASVGAWTETVHGAIVGTAIHEDSLITLPLSPARAASVRRAVR